MIDTAVQAVIGWDTVAAQWAAAHAHPLWLSLMGFVSWLFSPLPILFVIAWLYWNHHEKKAFYATTLVALSAMAGSALKFAFARLRPEFLGYPSTVAHAPTDFAFPSGHATLAGAIYGYVHRHQKWFLAFALVMAFSRVYLGAHFLSDVAAGLLIGYAVGKANRLIERRTTHMHFRITLLREEAILFASIAATLGIVLWLDQLYLAGLLIGFYAGYSAWKEMGMRQTGKGPMRLALGYFGLVVLGLGSLALPPTYNALGLVAAGAWISLFWPLLGEKVFKPARPLFSHPRGQNPRGNRRGMPSARKRAAAKKGARNPRRARRA